MHSKTKMQHYVYTTYDSNVSCMIGTPSSIGFGKSILSCNQSHSADGSWF